MDETGIDSYLYREYGYAPKGKSVDGKIPGRKFTRVNIVAGKLGEEIVAPMQYTGTTNSELFEFWFKECLLPCLPKDVVIVMDNATFHRKSKLKEISDEKYRNLIFLPPYSPELNPIENFWHKLKAIIRKTSYLFDSLDDSIYFAFQVV